MRCPKCGFHSFDYLDSCKKCGVDLTELRLRFKFQGYVAPAPDQAAPEPQEPTPVVPAMAEAEPDAIDFGFDALAEEGTEEAMEAGGDLFTGEAAPETVEPSTIALAADSGLIFDQPFGTDSESVPDNDLPKLNDRFDP